MDYYIVGEATTFSSPRSRGKVSITVIGEQSVPVQCLILNDHDECAVVVLDDYQPLMDALANPPTKPQRVGPLLNGLYLAVLHSAPFDKKYKEGISIGVVGVSHYWEPSVRIAMDDVERLILQQGRTPQLHSNEVTT